MAKAAHARKWSAAESSQTRRKMATLLGEPFAEVSSLPHPLPAHDLPLPVQRPRVQLRDASEAGADVTLVVYGWHNVQPGTLSWAFPNVRAALGAAHTMKNAIQWAIVRGESAFDLEAARTTGNILVERSG